MTLIKQILKVKGYEVLTIGPGETVYSAIKLMADKDVGSLLVTDGGRLLGIITERKYARDVFLNCRALPTLVRDIMEMPAACIEPDGTVDACLALMTEKRVRHLPVIDSERWWASSPSATWPRALLMSSASR